MKRLWIFAVLVGWSWAFVSNADEPTKPDEKKATFSITGLHCPPCTQTVESSLGKVPGVKSAKVDWTTKSAKLTFDESKVSIQGITNAIAKTPHMMGGDMSYGSMLSLSVPNVKDNASAGKARDALTKVSGVSKVSTFPEQHTVSVQLANGKDITTKQLIDALDAAGMKATTY